MFIQPRLQSARVDGGTEMGTGGSVPISTYIVGPIASLQGSSTGTRSGGRGRRRGLAKPHHRRGTTGGLDIGQSLQRWEMAIVIYLEYIDC